MVIKNREVFESRIIATGLVWNKRRELLFCKMPPDRGVFPGQWGFPGGGIKKNEKMKEALKRELMEEIGIEVKQITPALFKDGQHEKYCSDGPKKNVYMIFLIFHCVADCENILLNEEFTEYKWVCEEEVQKLDLNTETIDTLNKIGRFEDITL
jgi:nucleoside triphosphatase